MATTALATRGTFSDILDHLREHFVVEHNPDDTVWSPPELIRRLQGKQGVMSTGSERIVHPALLDLPNVVLTPHIGSAPLQTRRAMARLAVANLVAALGCGPDAGRPPTPANPDVLVAR